MGGEALTGLTATWQRWICANRKHGSSGKSDRAGLLVVTFLCSGPFFLAVLLLFWNQAVHLERSITITTRQLEISEKLLSFVHKIGRHQGAEVNSIREVAVEFDTSLGNLEREVRSAQRIPPALTDLSLRISEVRRLWDQIEAPLLGIAAADGSDPQAVRTVQSRTSALVKAWSSLAEDMGERRQALDKWLVCTFAVVAVFCLALLYSGLLLLKLHTRQMARWIEGVIERRRADHVWNTISGITNEELKALPGAFSGVSSGIRRLSSFFEQRCLRAESLVNLVPSGLLVLSPDLRVLCVNRRFLEAFGKQGREVLGRNLQEVLPSNTLYNSALRVSDARSVHQTVFVDLRENGEARSLRVTIGGSRPAEDPEARLFLIVEDVTEENNLRAARRESEQRYQKLLENVVEAVVFVDEDGLVVEMNPAAERLLERMRGDVVGRPLKLLMPENSTTAPEQRLGSLLSSGWWKLHRTALEAEFLRNDGSAFPAEVRLSSCRVGCREVFLLSLRDLSGYKLSELLAQDRLQVIELIAKNQTLNTVLAALTEMIERQLPGALCAVMLRENDRLYPAAAPNLPESYVRAVSGMPIGPSAASCGTAAFEGKIVSVSDIATDPLWADYREAALSHNLRASWSVPVHSSEGLIVGTIAIYHRAQCRPESAQLELLQMASRLAAVSVEQRQLTGRLAYQAQHDALTGLANRFTFEERMKHAIAWSRRHKGSVGLLSVDLDRFKLVNDTLGHAVGDGLLEQVARRIEDCVRETDVVARWGGDEFMVGLTELNDPRDAGFVAKKLLEAMRSPLEIEGHELFVTATIGASVYPGDGEDLAALMRNADRAMYRAKNQGRNNFRCYTKTDGDAASQRLELEIELRRALERQQLALHYQPQFEAVNCGLIGMEALLRWHHPKLGTVPPATFIPIAEETGLIIPIGAWVLQEVCHHLMTWEKAGWRCPRVAVNVSTLQFALPDFAEVVARTLSNTGIDPRLLELELTESMVMRNLEESTARMTRLRKLGVGIAIDDFGTGYSSLSCLQRLPIDTLKIDQSFVRDMTQPTGTLALVESIIGLARSLRMRTTAEGVETQVQLDCLRTAGCDQVQGFLLAKPLPVEEVLFQLGEKVPRTRRLPFLATAASPREDPGSRRRRKNVRPVTMRQPVKLAEEGPLVV